MLETIRAAIVAKLNAVPDIGRVHGYERYSNNVKDLRQLYVASIAGADQLRGWFVSRRSSPRQKSGAGPAMVGNRWEIVGYMAIDDAAATEHAMDALVEAACAAFWADQNLGGAVINCNDGEHAGLQVQEVAPVLFAGVLCHRAKLTLTTTHRQVF